MKIRSVKDELDLSSEDRIETRRLESMDDRCFRNILEVFNLSWKGYRKVRKGVKKRLTRHMQRLGIKDFESYIKLIKESPKIRKECEILLTVSISRFFRDKKLWEVLETKVLPDIIKKNQDILRVWSAGCARGEEVYTFKITWDRTLKNRAARAQLELLATDINPWYLEMAKEGKYGPSSLKEVPQEILDTYFEPSEPAGFFRVKDYLKSEIEWMEHNILNDPPYRPFHLVFLRNNLLTYYKYPLAEETFMKILRALAPGGYLVKGAHEKVPPSARCLVQTTYHPHVYQKLEDA